MAKVLIADDDGASRALVVTLLRHAGHEALEAADGATALTTIDSENPDLLIMDLSMPGVSGTEVIRQVQRRAKRPAIALYTATSPNDAMRDFMEMYGVRTIIPKPCEPQEFLEAVESILSPRARELR